MFAQSWQIQEAAVFNRKLDIGETIWPEVRGYAAPTMVDRVEGEGLADYPAMSFIFVR